MIYLIVLGSSGDCTFPFDLSHKELFHKLSFVL